MPSVICRTLFPDMDQSLHHYCSESSPVGGGIMSNSGLKKRQSEQGADDEKQQIKRLKFDENREGGLELKGTACQQSENLESSEGTSGQESKNVTPKDRSKWNTLLKLLWIHWNISSAMFGVCTYSEVCKVNVAAESKKAFFCIYLVC